MGQRRRCEIALPAALKGTMRLPWKEDFQSQPSLSLGFFLVSGPRALSFMRVYTSVQHFGKMPDQIYLYTRTGSHAPFTGQ